MAGSDSPPISLPNAQSLSKRTQKFYDGTYQWDSDGFVDDKGVYRKFDCYDPRSRAPTPLPPLSLGVEEDAEVLSRQTTDGMLATHESRVDNKILAFAPDPKRSNSVVTIRCSDLFRGHVDREHLIGKMEGALIASKANKVDLTLEECCRLCDIPYPDERAEPTLQENSLPPTGPSGENHAATAAGENNGSPATSPKNLGQKLRSSCSSSSSLSDCPSDLSEWDVGISVPALASTKNSQTASQEAQQPKYSTRGTARKAKTSAKKSQAQVITYAEPH